MIVIRCEHIDVVLNNMENGSTEPKVGNTDSNTRVVIKPFNCKEGNLVLFNEYFCYRLSLLVDIPMPHSGICLIDEKTTDYNCLNPDQYGYGFYSKWIEKAAPLQNTIVLKIQNLDDFYKIILFDHIIFNTDRNAENLLVTFLKDNIKMYAIDHTHVFINQAIWEANCLINAINEKDYYSTKVLKENDYLYSMFYRNISINKDSLFDTADMFSNKITDNAIWKIVSDIPETWMPKSRNLDALVKYLVYRIQHIQDICETIHNYIKK